MKLFPLICTSCKEKMRGSSLLNGVVCRSCGTANFLGKNGLEQIPAKYEKVPEIKNQDYAYFPFWKEMFEFKILKKESAGRFGSIGIEPERIEKYEMMVPAFNIGADELCRVSVDSVKWNLNLQKTPSTGIKFANISLLESDAKKLAEFVAGYFEVKRDGTMQSLTYETSFGKAELVFVLLQFKNEQIFDIRGRLWGNANPSFSE